MRKCPIPVVEFNPGKAAIMQVTFEVLLFAYLVRKSSG
jgi:hypothetical protein